ncbi:hypothetical protein PR048_016716 [Dryococelus australis]|uniref:Uncharacterized protein n=1 Tax=Dryococelus australis TaxID=614101 RepID=A0ABQ9H7I1_9NEOP|nr:hypothetical protein PR048_016716 [Dryococelus australis]
MAQRWNARARETRDHREKPPTSGIVQYQSHTRKSRNHPTRNRIRLALTFSTLARRDAPQVIGAKVSGKRVTTSPLTGRAGETLICVSTSSRLVVGGGGRFRDSQPPPNRLHPPLETRDAEDRSCVPFTGRPNGLACAEKLCVVVTAPVSEEGKFLDWKVVSYSAPTETAPLRVSFQPPPVSPPPPEKTGERDSHESTRAATRRHRAHPRLTSLSAGLPWHPTDIEVPLLDTQAVRLLASRQREPGSIPGRVIPDFIKWKSCQVMPLVGGFSRGSPFPHICIPVLLHTRITSPSSALKTSMLRAAQISLHSTLDLRDTMTRDLKEPSGDPLLPLHFPQTELQNSDPTCTITVSLDVIWHRGRNSTNSLGKLYIISESKQEVAVINHYTRIRRNAGSIPSPVILIDFPWFPGTTPGEPIGLELLQLDYSACGFWAGERKVPNCRGRKARFDLKQDRSAKTVLNHVVRKLGPRHQAVRESLVPPSIVCSLFARAAPHCFPQRSNRAHATGRLQTWLAPRRVLTWVAEAPAAVCPSYSTWFVNRLHATELGHQRRSEMSIEFYWNESAGEREIPEKIPPTVDIVRHDSHLRKSASNTVKRDDNEYEETKVEWQSMRLVSTKTPEETENLRVYQLVPSFFRPQLGATWRVTSEPANTKNDHFDTSAPNSEQSNLLHSGGGRGEIKMEVHKKKELSTLWWRARDSKMTDLQQTTEWTREIGRTWEREWQEGMPEHEEIGRNDRAEGKQRNSEGKKGNPRWPPLTRNDRVGFGLTSSKMAAVVCIGVAEKTGVKAGGKLRRLSESIKSADCREISQESFREKEGSASSFKAIRWRGRAGDRSRPKARLEFQLTNAKLYTLHVTRDSHRTTILRQINRDLWTISLLSEDKEINEIKLLNISPNGQCINLHNYFISYASIFDSSNIYNKISITLPFSPTSVRSMSRESQCSRVLQAPSRTVGFVCRFHTLSSIQDTNTSLAVVPQSPVVVHTSLSSRTLGHAASIKDCRPLGCGSASQSHQNILALSPDSSKPPAGERGRDASKTSSSATARRRPLFTGFPERVVRWQPLGRGGPTLISGAAVGEKSEISVKAVHDKVSTFYINRRKKSLLLPAHILTGALSVMRPVKLATMDGKAVPYLNGMPGQSEHGVGTLVLVGIWGGVVDCGRAMCAQRAEEVGHLTSPARDYDTDRARSSPRGVERDATEPQRRPPPESSAGGQIAGYGPDFREVRAEVEWAGVRFVALACLHVARLTAMAHQNWRQITLHASARQLAIKPLWRRQLHPTVELHFCVYRQLTIN